MTQFAWKFGMTFALVLALALSASMWSHGRERTHLIEARRIWLYMVATTKQLLSAFLNIVRLGGDYANA